jgi:hypothetical protein
MNEVFDDRPHSSQARTQEERGKKERKRKRKKGVQSCDLTNASFILSRGLNHSRDIHGRLLCSVTYCGRCSCLQLQMKYQDLIQPYIRIVCLSVFLSICECS